VAPGVDQSPVSFTGPRGDVIAASGVDQSLVSITESQSDVTAVLTNHRSPSRTPSGHPCDVTGVEMSTLSCPDGVSLDVFRRYDGSRTAARSRVPERTSALNNAQARSAPGGHGNQTNGRASHLALTISKSGSFTPRSASLLSLGSAWGRQKPGCGTSSVHTVDFVARRTFFSCANKRLTKTTTGQHVVLVVVVISYLMY